MAAGSRCRRRDESDRQAAVITHAWRPQPSVERCEYGIMVLTMRGDAIVAIMGLQGGELVRTLQH